ncbi:MAG: DsbA family protein [Xanthobacteraceae bacterium]|nr:DsbA family protein [Xanthobacteraceae bacterium]
MISRRGFVAGSMAFATFGTSAFAENDVLSEALVLRDPAIPVAGNPKGDISIVEFSDYQCPYCKKVHPVLEKVVREDGNIRLIYKIWPVFGAASVYAGQMVLASRPQKKYVEAHRALMTTDERLNENTTDKVLASAGVNVAEAKANLRKNIQEIGATLGRNHAQAQAFGFQGTPSFIIGKFRVPGAHPEEVFLAAIADARKALKK